MVTNDNADKEKTTLVQSVVPLSLADAIEEDAKQDGRSVSNTIARILGSHYAKRLASKAKSARKLVA